VPLHHVTDFERPARFDPATRAAIVAELTTRIRALEADDNGNVHRRDVLDALTDDSTDG
jgi:hypothetical protein